MPDNTAIDMPAQLGPALSATSDAPVGARPGPALSAVAGKGKPDVAMTPAPAVAKDEKPAVTEETTPPAKVADAKTDEADPGDEATPKPDAKPAKDAKDSASKDETPAWQKAEITKERNKRREAETANADAQVKLATALKALEQLTGKTPAAEAKVDAPVRPKRSDFTDPEAYDTALIEHTAKVTAAAVRAETETATAKATEDTKRAEQEAAQTEFQAQQQKSFKEKFDKAKEAIPDFEEVVMNDEVPVSQAAAHAIMELDNGPEVMYYLGKNPKEAERIAALTPGRQVVEIGRLSVRVEPKPELSKAPKPVTPIQSRNRASEVPLHEMSMDDYAEKRNAQLRAQRTRAT